MIYINDYINGKFVEQENKDIVRVVNPATKETIAESYKGTQKETIKAIQCAENAQNFGAIHLLLKEALILKNC